MKYNPDIFKVYDIRGIYGKDFDTDFAFQLGAALVEYLNRRRILVAYDDQKFSQQLAHSITDGITSMGGDAEIIGLASTPFFNYVFKKIGVDGGIMVTASHNDAEYAGFKIFGSDGDPIDIDSGMDFIKQFIDEGHLEISKYSGRIRKLDRKKLLQECMDYVIAKADIKPRELKSMRIKVDAPPSIQEKITYVFGKLQITACQSVCDITFTFDRDADRLLVYDKYDRLIHNDHILGLLVRDQIRFWHKPKVVHDLRFSRGVLEKLKEWGVRLYRSRVGRTFTRREMIKHKIDIGGELSGHIFFKETFYSEAPILAMLKILKVISKTGKTINQLVKHFETWSNSGEMNFPIPTREKGIKKIQELTERYKDGSVDRTDGILVEYPNWWFNLRLSNTEPLMRLVVEADSPEVLNEKIVELEKIIKS